MRNEQDIWCSFANKNCKWSINVLFNTRERKRESFQSKTFGHRLINYVKRTLRFIQWKDTLVSRELYHGHLRKTPFFSTPTQILNFHILVSGQLQVRTPFSRHEDVCLWKLPLYPSPSLNSIMERFCKELSYLSENPNIAIPEDNQASCYNLQVKNILFSCDFAVIECLKHSRNLLLTKVTVTTKLGSISLYRSPWGHFFQILII